jgi:hypothetical protein
MRVREKIEIYADAEFVHVARARITVLPQAKYADASLENI